MEQTVEGDTPLIAVVIVHWINIDDTIECIESLTKINYPQFQLFLVNNGSPDLDYEQVKKMYPEIHVILSKDNLGFAGGYNLGITKALQDDADFVFILNNDTVVSPDIFNYLLPPFSDQDVGIVGPVIEHYFEPRKIWFAGGNYNRLLGFSYRHRPVTPFDNNITVDWINGCSMLVKRDVFELIGTFWEPFYFLVEDLDFCLRAFQENIRCVQVGQPLVRHKISASGGIPGTDLFSPDKAYYYARNSLLLIKRDDSGLWRITGILSQFFVVLPFWFVYCFVHRNLGFLPHYLVGLWDGILGRNGKRK